MGMVHFTCTSLTFPLLASYARARRRQVDAEAANEGGSIHELAEDRFPACTAISTGQGVSAGRLGAETRPIEGPPHAVDQPLALPLKHDEFAYVRAEIGAGTPWPGLPGDLVQAAV